MRSVALAMVSLALLSLPATALGQGEPVLPVDQAARDPEFFLFRARLQAAVAAHDTAELLRAVAPDIRNSFGGDGGRAEFRQSWKLTDPAESPLWGALGFVLALGGEFLSDSLFYAPYTFQGTPGDGFETLAVVGRNVLIRESVSASARVVDTVSFETVSRWREGAQRGTTPGWEPVRTANGRTGWVSARYVRSPIDYRAGFMRRQGRWQLVSLLAGD